MDELNNLERMVLDHVRQSDYRPVKPRVIAKQLSLSDEQHRDLKKAIKRLVKRGRISYGRNHLVLPAQRQPAGDRQLVGVFRRAAGGFGFVRPNLTSGLASDQSDVYIPFNKTLDAADGDIVSLRLDKRGRRADPRRRRGEIVEVIERDTHQFVGTYFERADAGYVQVDGTVFAQPILVSDAGAKNAHLSEKVVIEMVRFPSHFQEGEGVIVEVLGPSGAPRVDTLTVMREYRLPESFPEAVLEAAREEAEHFDGSIGNSRLDRSDLTVVTIDPQDARDFDDAISLEQIEKRHWRLGVHIADVSHFVRPDTVLDVEARKRATSVYLPDRVVPMLPEIISNNLASLQPNRVRYAMSVFIEFTPDATRVDTEVQCTAIRSDRRFTYEEVDDFLANPKDWKARLDPDVHALLARMHRLAMQLRQRRLDGGAIELTLPEIRIELDRDGRVTGAQAVEHTESHQVIEEFMLAANEAVAQMLKDRELVLLRRIHEPPDPRKLEVLTQFVRELGIACDNLASRFEIKRIVEQVADRPERHAVNYAVLRSMRKAVYSPLEEGHYALGSKSYCHFTSPIRRYPDLSIHRMLKSLARGEQPVQDFDRLALLGDHCSQREQRAEKAERELTKIKLLNFLNTKIGEQMDAVITGVEDFGLFAQGVSLPAEGLIHVNSLQDDYYDYDRSSHSLVGRRAGNSFRLGDIVRVEIAHVDVGRREMDFRLFQSKRKKPATRQGKKRKTVKRREKTSKAKAKKRRRRKS